MSRGAAQPMGGNSGKDAFHLRPRSAQKQPAGSIAAAGRF
jgi:hypothetical protein